MQQKNISQIMKILLKEFPSNEQTTLNRMRQKPNPYKILISCLLSLRARDENTEKVSAKLFEVADTPEKITKLPTRKLEKIIYSSGHYKKKARTLKHVSRDLIKKFNSKVPSNKEDLMSIKGIGPKTANIVLNFAYDKLVIPVDVHVHIIANRLGWVNTKTAEKTEPALENILPKKYWNEINGIFVLLGKKVCQTFSPKCSICPINQYCSKINIKRSR